MRLKIDEWVDAVIGFEDPESRKLLETMEEYLKTEVRIRKLNLTSLDRVELKENAYLREWLVDDEKIKIRLEKIFS